MNMDEFQNATAETAVYPEAGEGTVEAINYCIMGLCGEAGEVANKWKKILRGDDDPELFAGLAKELMDLLWYVARALDELDVDMAREAPKLLEHLEKRKRDGVVKGSGDDR